MSIKTPHIIVIVVDALSYKRMSMAGYRRDTTPYLKAFASDAVNFPYATSHSPLSGLSVGSIMTGSFAFDHQDMPIAVGTSRPPVTAVLHDAGYYTALVTANPYYARRLGYSEGVDRYVTLFNEEEELRRIKEQTGSACLFHALNKVPLYRGAKLLFKRVFAKTYEASRIHKARLLTQRSPFGDVGEVSTELIRVIRECPRDQPLFLMTHIMDLHAPNYAPAEYLQELGGGIPVEKQQEYAVKRTVRPLPPFTAPELEDLVLLYDACLLRIDREIRKVVEELKERDMYDDSLIIVTADHGEAFFEHGDLGHHAFLYDETVQVPLMVKFPGSTGAGESSNHLANHIDIMPTIAAAAGVSDPPTVLGIDLSQHVHRPRRHAVSFVTERLSKDDVSRLNFSKFKLAIRTKDWKLIISHDGSDELYDLKADPDERDNLADRSTDRVQAAHRELSTLAHPYLERIHTPNA